MKRFIALAILIVAIGSHVNHQVEAQGSTVKYGFELAEGFDIEFLYELDSGGYPIHALDGVFSHCIGGRNNDIIIDTSDVDYKDVIVWYQSSPKVPDSIPVTPKVIIKETERNFVDTYSIVGITPAGENSFYMVVYINMTSYELYKVTGPFEPARIFGSSLY